ncbi:MAG TPA: M48 family metalloprotease [Vicinamibacteria bacterium]|nr:M48 family metalloprotease [Vicinamibacteria bacterium]
MNRARVLALLAAFALAPVASRGAPRSRDAFEARVEAELQTQSPDAVVAWTQGNAARDAGDHRKAAALFEQVAALSPGFSHAKRRLAGEELALGHRPRAIVLARQALAQEPSSENMVGLALTLSREAGGSKPTAAERKEAYRLALRAVTKTPDDYYAQATLAQLALATDELATFRKAADRLLAIAPEEVGTHHVAFLRALIEQRWDDATAALDRAHALGLPDADYQKMLALSKSARSPAAGWLPKLAWAGGLWLGFLALLLLAGSVLSTAVLREAAALPRQASGQAQGGSASLKKTYAAVLWLSCAYYYVSLPIVAVVVVGAGGGILYALFAIGRIPVKLVLIVVVMVFATLWSMLKGLFARSKDEDPGDRMDLRTQPRLRALLGDVARRVGTRPVDNVYLTPGTELAVMERGGMGRQLRGRAERCLILGVGVLEGLKIGSFKAVLAHEYGHFTNKDTAGGGFALAVRRSLVTMARSMAESGAAAFYNPAWLFLSGFFRVFLRISQGASRLQEILADRWAAFTYGSKAFEEGLRHVIEQSVRFDARAGAALQEMAAQPVANLYQHRPEAPVDQAEIDKAIRGALNRPSSPYDSHPSPAERSRWVRALNAKGTVQSAEDSREAWGLFESRPAIEERMTGQVRAMVLAAQALQDAQKA